MKLKKLKNKFKNIIKASFLRGENLVSYVEAKEMLKENSNSILLDVRSIQEYNEYHLNGAICIPTYEIAKKIENIVDNKEQIIILYCQSGTRSRKTATLLKQMGYINVYEIRWWNRKYIKNILNYTKNFKKLIVKLYIIGIIRNVDFL